MSLDTVLGSLVTKVCGLAAFLAVTAPVAAQTLRSFAMHERNDIGERTLAMEWELDGKPYVSLRVPLNKFAAHEWVTSGRFELDWSTCRTTEMLRGSGELGQCVRRAHLAIRGEADKLMPATLVMQVLANGHVAVSMAPGIPNAAAVVDFIADTQDGPAAWQAFRTSLADLPPAQRPPVRLAPRHPSAADIHTTGDLPPQPNAKVGTHLLLIGDSGTGTADQYQVARAMEAFCAVDRCDFSLLLGDNFYNFGVNHVDDPQFADKFEKPYAGLSIEFRAALGNHDHYGNIKAQIDYAARSTKFHLPGRYYAYRESGTTFYAIDTDDFDDGQARWLDAELGKAGKTWRIVYGHHPIYSYGEHGDSAELMQKLLPILKRHKVPFYVAGHDHDKQVIERDGIVFVISGAAAKLRATRTGPYTKFAKSSLGFAHLAFDGDTARLRFLGTDGKTEFEKSYKKTP